MVAIASAMALVFVLAAGGLAHANVSVAKKPCIKVAFVYNGEVKTPGFERGQYLGEKYLRKQLPCAEVTRVENVAEGPGSAQTFARLANDGYELIFGLSFGFGDQILEVAADNPDTKFEHALGFQQSDNVSTFYGARYEASYLAGIAAADKSEGGKVGYVAPFPIPSILADINAFTLGLRSVNPDATVQVVWTNAFEDPVADKQAAEALVDGDVDFIVQSTGTPSVGEVATANDLPWSSYDDPATKKFGPETWVAAPYLKWGLHFLDRAKAVIDGEWESQDYLGTIADGYVTIALSKGLSAEVRQAIAAKQAEIADGSFVVFAGPLTGQQGQEIVPEGQTASFDDITSQFVEGVIGEIPSQ